MCIKNRLSILALLMLIFAFSVLAVNIPEQVINSTSESRSISAGDKTALAYGSNVTRLTINDVRVTRRWQGYYGNVSGVITLDDANNWTMFDWDINARGEVFASNASGVQWGTIRCINLSNNYRGHNCTGQDEACLNISEIESAYNINSGDSDGLDETFNGTLGSILVGLTSVYNCPMVNLYVNDTSQSSYFWNETLLTYNNSETIIYTSIVSNDQWGFNNQTYDFQMIVGDNGDDSLPTSYYFYVELS